MTATKTAKTYNACLCGCGSLTLSIFAPGHDARLAGRAAREIARLELGMEAGFEPLPAWLAGQTGRTAYTAIAQRSSTALAEKFMVALGNATAKLTRKASKAAKVVEIPACPTCGAKGEEFCKNARGRKLPHGRNHADRPTATVAA